MAIWRTVSHERDYIWEESASVSLWSFPTLGTPLNYTMLAIVDFPYTKTSSNTHCEWPQYIKSHSQ